MRLKPLIAASGLFAFALAPASWAGVDQMAKLATIVEQLQRTVLELQNTVSSQNDRIRLLEDRQPELHGVAGEGRSHERLPDAVVSAPGWLQNLKFGGDIRLRYEAFDQSSGHPSETDDRTRFRYRLRYGFEKKLTSDINIGFAMASGEQSGGTQADPTTTNTTFDGLFNFKDIFVEQVFATYTPAWAKAGLISLFEVTAGKFRNPFEQGSSDMVWDRDVRPEGAYEKVDFNLVESADFDLSGYAIAGQFVLDEDSVGGSDADSELYAFQLGLKPVVHTPFFDEPLELVSSVSWYHYSDFTRDGNFMIGTTSLAGGNSNFTGSATELDAEEFEILEFYHELSLRPYGVPLRPFFDLAVNVANASQQNDEALAWALGTRLGGINKKGDWELSYAYRRIENDSVVGAFNDSDFGFGHSGKRGNVFRGVYALTEHVHLNAAAFFVNNLTTGTAGVRDEEQRRFQLDLLWKF